MNSGAENRTVLIQLIASGHRWQLPMRRLNDIVAATTRKPGALSGHVARQSQPARLKRV